MPKLRRALSIFLAVWLCVMLVTFTYTWVSRNWTPSIQGDDINIQSSGALVISLLGDHTDANSKVILNDIVGLGVNKSFTFRQVSSQDGINFFWKDFTPTVDGVSPAILKKIGTDNDDPHKADYVDVRFCLKLDGTLEEPKYVFIHPDTYIKYENSKQTANLEKAIRISLTYEKMKESSAGNIIEKKTVILANLGSDEANKGVLTTEYQAVLADANNKLDNDPTTLDYQTVYGLQYFDCGRLAYDSTDPNGDVNYVFTTNKEKALFKLEPGELIWIDMRIWLEGQDINCNETIAGENFDLFLKFDSAFVQDPT